MSRQKLTADEIARGVRLAEKLKKRREHIGYTQEKLADISGVRIDTLRAIEGKKVPQPGVFTLSDLATALEIAVEELVPARGKRRPRSGL